MENKMYFVKTSDEATAEKLRKEGFQELAKEGNSYVFVNKTTTVSFDQTKVNYTNRLFV